MTVAQMLMNRFNRRKTFDTVRTLEACDVVTMFYVLVIINIQGFLAVFAFYEVNVRIFIFEVRRELFAGVKRSFAHCL